MLMFIAAAVWGLVLLASFLGWGVIVNRALFPDRPADAGLRFGWGVACLLAIGGVLNLLRQVSRGSILVLTLIGLAALSADLIADEFRRGGQARRRIASFFRSLSLDRISRVLFLAVVALVAIRYLGQVACFKMNRWDDYPAYLVFIRRMIETGTLGDDPYNSRRIESGMNSLTFLQCFVRSFFPEKNTLVLDACVGLAGLLLATIGLSRDLRLSRLGGLVLAGVAAIALESGNNITGTLMAVNLMIALWRTIPFAEQAGRRTLSNALLVGLLAAGLGGTKAINIPWTSSFLFFVYLVRFVQKSNRPRVFFEFVAAGCSTLVFLAPWMESLHRASGTYLYPLLGNGFHGSSYSTDYKKPYDELTILTALSHLGRIPVEFWTGVSVVLGAFALRGRKLSRMHILFLPIAASSLFTIILNYLMFGNHGVRYSFPMFLTTTLFFLGAVFESSESSESASKLEMSRVFVIYATVAFLVGALWRDDCHRFKLFALNIFDGVRDRAFLDPDWERQYRELQCAIPKDAPLMARLDLPFYLDFRRNTIHAIDFPGGVSPPPGIPVSRGGEPLEEYLRSKKIRYLIFSYLDAQGGGYAFQPDVEVENLPFWDRVVFRHTAAFDRSVMELCRSRRRLYDDGKRVALDLEVKQDPSRPDRGPIDEFLARDKKRASSTATAAMP